MRSLTTKLTAAFLLVGLTGALLVALLVALRTRSEFDRFLSERDQQVLVAALADYYAAQNGWADVGAMLASTPPLSFYSRDVALADAAGVVVLARGQLARGQQVAASELQAGVPVQLADRVVGHVLFTRPVPQPGDAPRPDPAGFFLDRVTLAAALSALIAALIALLLGALLARTLARPVRELTAATQAMARGQLGQQVLVRSRDEIGELATSFNQMSADLAHASQLRKQMTADLAHDLRTPLSILRGYTEGLQDGRLRGDQRLYTIMHSEVEHLQRLVEDLRVLSLADAGELPLSRRAVDPAALIERTGLAYFDQAERQGVTLAIEVPAGLPSIAVDTDRMAQVLNNLVSNALRHSQGGQVTLAAHAAGGGVALAIRDTGTGIAPADLPFVFDRFYRADKARQRGDDGASGLGLAISKAIVEAHGGTISVDSTPGSGTTFTVALPCA